MSEFQLELWESILVCCVGDSLSHIYRGPKKSGVNGFRLSLFRWDLWEDEDGLALKAGRHVSSCIQEILSLCAELSLLKLPPWTLPWALNHCHHPPERSWTLWAAPLKPLDTSHMAPPLLAVPYSPCTLASPWLCLWVPFVRLSHNQHVCEKGNAVRMLMGLLSLSLSPNKHFFQSNPWLPNESGYAKDTHRFNFVIKIK